MSSDDLRRINITSNAVTLTGRVHRPHDPATDDPIETQRESFPVLRDLWRDRVVIERGIIVRQVGGVLPAWAEPMNEDRSACMLDLLILHDTAAVTAIENGNVGSIACRWRVVVAEPQILASDATWRRIPRADVAVSAAIADLESVARSFVDAASNGGMIGVDWGDVLDVINCRGSRAAKGRAVIVQGQGLEAGQAVRDALGILEPEGDVGSVFLAQSVSVADTPLFELWSVDAMATVAMAARDRSLVLICHLDQPRTEVVVIAFEAPGRDRFKGTP